MIRENLAERLFCDLKNAGVKIATPRYVVDGAKIGDMAFPDIKQIVLSCYREKHNVNYGHTFDQGELSFTEAYNKLLEMIKEIKHVKLHSLVIPRRGVIAVEQLEYEQVVCRYIKDYLHMTDDTLERWDVMVSPA